ncbi:MAG: AAA family ATPase [Putridiphycobacter sp.]|nr:AAA family ATPase [Putridiphycobacter sp.]
METTQKEQIRKAVLDARTNFGGSDSAFANVLGISPSIFSRLKKGQTDKIVSDETWLDWAMTYNVDLANTNWKIVETRVYKEIRDNLMFCQMNGASMMLADENGIGKTVSAKYVTKQLKNAFYVDCSQAHDKRSLMRLLCQTVGLGSKGNFNDLKTRFKFYINTLETPLIVLDEFGDIEYQAFLMIKELYNGTEGSCAWYAMGAQALKAKMRRGINNEKIGYAELFDRFSGEIVSVVPTGPSDKMRFYQELIRNVANANMADISKVEKVVKMCVSTAENRSIRYLKTLVKNANRNH